MSNKQSPEPLKIEPAFLTVPQLCEYLNICRAQLYRIKQSGALGVLPVRLGTCRKVLYSRTELDAYIKASTIAGKFISRQQWQSMKKEFMK